MIATLSLLQGKYYHSNDHNSTNELNNTVNVRVVKQTFLIIRSIHKVLVVSTKQGLMCFETVEQPASRELMMFVKEITEVLPNQPLFTLLVS